jgi:multimeric flavodoxin WrbA
MEKLNIKILALSCSNRLNSDIAWMCQYALKVVEKFGRRVSDVADYETKFIELADKDLKPCINCNRRPCALGGGRNWEGGLLPCKPCPIKDYHQELGPEIQKADGLIIGASTSLGTYNSRFRLMWEAISRGREMLFGEHWLQHNNRLPVGVLTCADDGPGSGVETCLNDLNITVRFLEAMPVSMVHGAWLFRNPSWRPVPEGGPYTVKNNRDSLRWLFSMSRRVAEYALMLKLTKEVLGDVFKREFMGRYHEPWGADETWAWRRLDKEDEEYMMNLPIEMKLPEWGQPGV